MKKALLVLCLASLAASGYPKNPSKAVPVQSQSDFYQVPLEYLTSFALATEQALGKAYLSLRSYPFCNAAVFYLLSLGVTVLVLKSLFGKKEVSFSYKIVEEKAEGTIQETISRHHSKLEEELENLKKDLKKPSEKQAIPQEFFKKVEQLASEVKAIQELQKEFQTEIQESHQDIWKELICYNTEKHSKAPNQEQGPLLRLPLASNK